MCAKVEKYSHIIKRYLQRIPTSTFSTGMVQFRECAYEMLQCVSVCMCMHACVS